MLGTKKATKLDNAITELDGDVAVLALHVNSLIARQDETNKLLRELISVNKDFTHVIENFFAFEKKLDIEEARRREKKEMELKPTDADERY